MANPQIEDGHVDIANEIAEALCRINLSAYESRILWALFRKTYGWHKKSDRISYTQWEKLTDLNRRHIARALRQLSTRKIIIIRGNKRKLEYAFQKNYEKWITDISGRQHSLPVGATKEAKKSDIVTSRGNSSLPVGVTKSLPVGVNTKEKKETIQKKRIQALKKSPDPLNEFRKKVFEGLKERRGNQSPVPGAEAKAITWMLKQGYNVEQILNSYDVLKGDPFWADKFLNMQSVKTQIGEIFKGKRGKGGTNRGSPRALPDKYKTPEQHLEDYRKRANS